MGHGIRSVFAALGGGVCVLLSGCAASFSPVPVLSSTGSIQGRVHGGQQPVAGAHVYLMAAAVSGSVAGGNGYGNASVSMLSGTGYADAVGGYVLTDSNGNFSITGDYNACNVAGASNGSQVYLYATGGNSGGGVNSAIGLLAALGTCGSLSSSTTVTMNEATTIAMGYALAGFATDALHISIPQYTTGTTADTLAATGLANAFVNATLLANTATGVAQSVVAAASKYGAGAAPQTTVNTLANILAVCVNTADQSEGPTVLSANCQTLLNTATSTGIAVGTTGSGAVAANTATAAIYIAQNPGSNVSTLTGLIGATPPFAPALSMSTTPNDLTLGITYTGGGLNAPVGVAIDIAGDAWIQNENGSSLIEISATGDFLSGASGIHLSYYPNTKPAIDQSGDVWIGIAYAVARFSSTGVAVSGSPYILNYSPVQTRGLAIDSGGNAWVSIDSTSYGVVEITPGGSQSAFCNTQNCGIDGEAIDASGRVWVGSGDFVYLLSSTGSLLDSSPFSSLASSYENQIAIDSNNAAWIDGNNASTLVKVMAPASGSPTYEGPYKFSNFNPVDIAIDGANHLWLANDENAGGVAEVSNSGVVMSPTNGYQGGNCFYSVGVAIDGSGDVWLGSWGSTGKSYQVVELIGAAVPVATPIVAGLTAPYTPASRP